MTETCNTGTTEPPHTTAKNEARNCLSPLASEKGNRPDVFAVEVLNDDPATADLRRGRQVIWETPGEIVWKEVHYE